MTNFDNIFINGEEVGRGKVTNDLDGFAKFYQTIDKSLPVKAEVFMKVAQKPKAKELQVNFYLF